MNLRASILAGALFAVAAPSSAQAAPDWLGDFETGDFSQWTLSAQVISNMDNMTVVDDVVLEGSYAARIQCDPGEMSPSGHSRNEVVYTPDPGSFEGSERWFAFSVRPGSEPWAESNHQVWYFEGNPVFTAVMALVVVGQQIRFQTYIPEFNTLWQGALPPEQWREFMLHVRWSPDAATGFVELFVDGVQVVPMTSVATMHGPGVMNEMHMGMIRNPMISISEVVYIDGVREGATMEDVMGTNPPGTTSGGEGSTGDGPPDGTGDDDPDGGETSDPDDTGGNGNGNGSGGPGGDTNNPGSGSGDVASTTGGEAGGDDDSSGCSCTSGTGGSGTGLPWLLGLVAVGLGRRASRRGTRV